MTPIICYILDDLRSSDKKLPPRAEAYELDLTYLSRLV